MIGKLDFFQLIKKTKNPENARTVIVWDTDLKGFGIRVSRTKKVYVCQKSVRGKNVRVRLGSLADFRTPEDARASALKILSRLASGENINETNRQKRIKEEIRKRNGVTLKQAFERFKEVRGLKPKTLYDYEKGFDRNFKDWKDLKITEITRQMVSERHQKIKKNVIRNRKRKKLPIDNTTGNYEANVNMKFIQSLFTFIMGEYENENGESIVSRNPVQKITQTKTWFKVRRKKSIIKNHEYPEWYKAVMELKNETVKDYFIFQLLLGLRKDEGLKLERKNVDLMAKTIKVNDTKNGEEVLLPMGKYVFKMIRRRLKKVGNHPYVFPSNVRKNKPMAQTRIFVDEIREKTKIYWTLHRLRAGFINMCKRLRLPIYEIKELVNHNIDSDGDVTTGYMVSDPEPLREPMQRIEDELLKLCQAEGI